MIFHTQTCSPADEALVQKDGSYPSAQAAAGWTFSLVLAELNPSRSDLILQRGRDFGESRVICDAQWQSDVDAGQQMGSIIAERLHRNPDFRKDLEAAKVEVASAMRAGARPAARCDAPAALASR